MFKKFYGNKHTKFGKAKEPIAKEIFQDAHPELKVINEVGLIINPKFPWLGFSPDGFTIDAEGRMKLIEIKSLEKGKRFTGIAFCKQLPCLTVNEERIEMKKKHKFYGQVQLSLALSNLTEAVFLLYVHKNRSVIIIDVPIDLDFVSDMMSSLTNTYFTYFLPFLYENKERLIE
jgi:hypothetical protein